jgi:phosphatidylethanolamine-binding protein (PEBP) family uncharacterized protein
MKKLILGVIAVSFLVFSCAGTKTSPNAVNLGVNFNLEPKHKCSSVSPKITVSNIPAGTKELKVVLIDRDVPTWNHGGGILSYKGSGVIPEGALKSGYNGPCPPSGSHTYEFKVKAIDAKGVIAGIGSNTQSFP